MNRSVLIGERIREERQRLGKNQTDFGGAGGVTKKTQMLYESGDRSPDASYLSDIATYGADIQYIVTGQHPERLPAPPLKAEVLEAVIEWLEDRLARSRKSLSPEKKAHAILLAYQLVAHDETISPEKLAPVLKLVA